MRAFRSLDELYQRQDGAWRGVHEGEGTVKIIDQEHRFKERDNIVLVPQPSDDPNDPLNWPNWKRRAAYFSVAIFSGLGTWVVSGIGSGLILIMNEFGEDLQDTVNGAINWSILTLGFANFFWIPCSMFFGTRPTFLCASIGLFLTSIWRAKATSFGSVEGGSILNAFFSAAGEALPAAVVQQLFFLHERGRWMGIYTCFISGGSAVGAIISGFAITSLGWRWHFWLCSIFIGVNFLMLFFLLPETRYPRGQTQTTPTTDDTSAPPTTEKAADATEAESASEDLSFKQKSYLQQLSPWSGITKDSNIINLFLRPWPLVLYPATIFALTAFTLTIAWSLAVLNTAAGVYQLPPYNFSPGIQSLIWVPGLIGIIAGSVWGGLGTDIISKWLARKKNGIFEPEYRLVVLILPFFIIPAGLILYGYGVANQMSWVVGYIGNGFMCFGITCVPAVTIAYVIDCYHPISPEMMFVIIGIKNVLAFAFSYSIVPWTTKAGYKSAFGTMAGIQVFVVFWALPLWYFGKRIRQFTGSWKLVYC